LAADDYLYTLQAGDNPWNLSERLLVDMSYWPRLVAHNRIIDDRRLPPGSTLRIPRAWLKLRSASVQLGALTGEVEFDQGQGWIAAQSGSPLAPGTRLRTGDQGSAALRLADGAQVLMRGASEIRLIEADTAGNGALLLRIELLRGRLENAVHPLRATGGRFEIVTPSAITAVRGTEFRISADAQTTRSEVLDGAVLFGNRLGNVTLGAATGSLAARDEAPRRPQALLPPPTLQGIPAHWEQAELALQWPPVDAAEGYRVQLLALDAEGHSDGTTLLDRLTPEAALPAVPLPDGRYLLRARAVDSLGLEGLHSEHKLAIDTQPPAPRPRTPGSQGPVTRQTGTLGWQSDATGVPAGRRYRVQIAGPAGFTAPLEDQTTADTVWALPTTLPPGRYQWRVASIDATDQGPWCAVQTLQLIASPPDLVDVRLSDRLHLRWHTNDGAAPVRLQVARDADFTELLLDEPKHGDRTTLPRPAAGTYHLRLGSLPGAGRPVVWGPVHWLEIGWGRWHSRMVEPPHTGPTGFEPASLAPTAAGPAASGPMPR
jgi:hypothetical protein